MQVLVSPANVDWRDAAEQRRRRLHVLSDFGLQLELRPPPPPSSSSAEAQHDTGGGRGGQEARGAAEGRPPQPPPPMPSEEELEAMGVKQLKVFLQSHLRVSAAGCLEKSELLLRAKAGRARALNDQR